MKVGNITKSGMIEKGIATLLIESQFKNAISKYFYNTKFDLILYSTPPITLANTIFTKKKIKMRAGETDKAVSFKNEKLFELIRKFVSEAGYRGQIDIDIDGEYYISEVTPRFGGGYPHAYESGCDHMKFITTNLEGKVNEIHIGEYESGIYMMKYNELYIRKDG